MTERSIITLTAQPPRFLDELPPLHSMTSSARASNEGGTVRPSALAVLRLIIISNLVSRDRSPCVSAMWQGGTLLGITRTGKKWNHRNKVTNSQRNPAVPLSPCPACWRSRELGFTGGRRSSIYFRSPSRCPRLTGPLLRAAEAAPR
jgi:hypothetical protein